MNLAEQVQANIAEMEQILNDKTPGLPNLLRTIHTQLKKDPEVVTILTDDEAATIIRGLKEHTGQEIAAAAMKSKPKKSLKNTTVDDL